MRALAAALALVPLLAAGPLADAAHAKRGPCIPGKKKPKCRIWTGKIIVVDDGDTVNVKIKKGRRWSKRTRIRLTGVQAMELTRYSRARGRRGECNSVAATERLEYLLQGRKRRKRKVRIAAHRASSTTGSRGRLRRAIAFRSRGRWHDAGTVLMREGLGLWFPNQVEWAWNRPYAKLAAQAAREGKRIWDDDGCKPGPFQDSPLRMKLKWDANGVDGQNVNGEWVRITNTGQRDVSLRGWWFRDSHLRRYRFPAGAVVPAGRSIMLRMGQGTNDADTYYWGQRASIFENVTADRKSLGDGGYLFDPQGDLRAYVMYPCRLNCSEPLAGKVEVRASYRAPEYVRIRNTSTGTIDLSEYELESRPWFYEFPRGTTLLPGQTLFLWIGNAPGGGGGLPIGPRLIHSWGRSEYLLSDNKDVVTLRNRLGAPVTCHAWGGERCPKV